MLLDNVNLNHVRVFECVFRTRNMTTAAHELHLTQSGVSQHIRSLEDTLGLRLFDRIRQRIVPTGDAVLLFKSCSESLHLLEAALSQIKGGQKRLVGSVSIGMPVEFGNNILLPLITDFCRQHPLVSFTIRYGLATEMLDSLLDGTLDFAFVDAYRTDHRLDTQNVYDEILYLCASPNEAKHKTARKEDRAHFESLEYVDYEAGEPVIRMWFKHHLGTSNLPLKVRATGLNAQGVAKMIQSGKAAGVLPGHLVADLEARGVRVHKFKGCGKPLKNSISIACLKERSSSNAARSAIQHLTSGLKKS